MLSSKQQRQPFPFLLVFFHLLWLTSKITDTLNVTVLAAVLDAVEKKVEVMVVVPVLSTTNLGLLSMSDLWKSALS